MEYSFRKSIIFVDDVRFSLITTKERLKKHYEVFPAQTSDELFNLLGLTRPDLILLDINMPGVDGFEILKKLKDDESYCDIPVILLSGQNDKDTVVTGIGLGAAAHVSKPYTDKVLIETIESVLRGEPQPKSSTVNP